MELGTRSLFAALLSEHPVVSTDPAVDVSPLAGTGEGGFAGDGSSAAEVRFAEPYGLAVAPAGGLYAALGTFSGFAGSTWREWSSRPPPQSI